MARGKRLTGIDLLKKKISDLEELSSIIEEKGLSIEEVKKLIDNQSSEK